jgi:hypothetical protein
MPVIFAFGHVLLDESAQSPSFKGSIGRLASRRSCLALRGNLHGGDPNQTVRTNYIIRAKHPQEHSSFTRCSHPWTTSVPHPATMLLVFPVFPWNLTYVNVGTRAIPKLIAGSSRFKEKCKKEYSVCLDDLGAKTTLPNSGVWLEGFPLRKLPPN